MVNRETETEATAKCLFGVKDGRTASSIFNLGLSKYGQ